MRRLSRSQKRQRALSGLNLNVSQALNEEKGGILFLLRIKKKESFMFSRDDWWPCTIFLAAMRNSLLPLHVALS